MTLGHDLLTPPPPRLVAIGGPSGTGKTSLARRAAPDIPGPAPGAVVLRTDVTRKELFGRPAGERLPPDAYTPEVSARVFATIAERTATTLRAGYSVVADGVYGSPEQRAAIEAVAAAQGLPFHGFWLDAPLPILEGRVAARRGDASDADAAVVRRQVETIDAGSVAWRRVAADGPLDAVAAEIADELGHPILGSPVP